MTEAVLMVMAEDGGTVGVGIERATAMGKY